MKHLIPEFDEAARALSRRASSPRSCCRACAASRKTAATSPTSDIDGLVAYLGVPRIQIEEVLSFYGQFRRKPIGRCHIQACRNVVVLAARRRADHRPPDEQRSASRPGETTPDGRFTLSTVECLASCGTAPVLMVERRVPREHDAREARRAARRRCPDMANTQAPDDLPGHRHVAHAGRVPRARRLRARSRRRCSEMTPQQVRRGGHRVRHPGPRRRGVPDGPQVGGRATRTTASRTTCAPTPTRASRARSRTAGSSRTRRTCCSSRC